MLCRSPACRSLILSTALALAQPALALTLDLPESAEQTASDVRPAVQATFPASRWIDGAGSTERAEGTLVRTAWRLGAASDTTLQIVEPLREQIVNSGYEIVFECEAGACGGFDFRFATNTLDAPQMYVDLANYHYLLARKDSQLASIMVSRARDTGFVQLTRLVPTGSAPEPALLKVNADRREAAPLWEEVERNGHAPLDDLLFRAGSAELDGTRFASLDALAAWMKRDPGLRLTLVGHTDAEGSLAANIALSKRRAEAVRNLLVNTYGVDPGRLGAEGVGYLAPRASNSSPEGRLANRRVEVILSE